MENLGGWDQTEDHPDFDPNFLNVESWGVDHEADDVHVNVNSVVNDQHDTNNGGRARKKSWGDSRQPTMDQWSASLGVTDFDHHPAVKQGSSSNTGNPVANNINENNLHLSQSSGDIGIPTEAVQAAVEAAVAAISETSDSVASSSENNSNTTTQHLHPLGIQSSAKCPTPANASGQNVRQQQQQQQQVQQQQLQQQAQLHHHQQQLLLQQQQQQLTLQGATNATPAVMQNLSSLTANFVLAQAANSTVAASAGAAAVASAPVISPPSTIRNTTTTTKNPKASASGRKRGGRPKSTKSTRKKKGAKAGSQRDSNTLPPFYLFDAPIELRANFMQNQRRLGLPIQHDPNSYHYGETVNGFHPHQYQLPLEAAANSNTVSSSNTANNNNSMVLPTRPPPKLIDARHGKGRNGKGGQVKNEREQKRAQKITELIEELRLQMEDGGWQVEARSKFHTLSNCAQYIKHMIKLTSEKEAENSKLEEKQRKLQRENEEKAMQEGRSDPESVTSSLTSDTTMSTARHTQEEGESGETKKRKLSSLDNGNCEGGGSSGEDSNNNSINNADANKKHRVSSEAMTEDSSGYDNRGGSGTGSGNSRTESGSGGSGSGGISKTISSVSELTDSNRDSGSGGGSSDYVPTVEVSRESTNREEGGADQLTTSSISSDVAVTSDKTSRDRNTGHKDVVFNNKSRLRPPEEVTSLERTFELNYEEVFHKSNIPQLIASTSGKIMTWNECFRKATGYRKSEIEQMTIFSLVKPENLASFFEIVAAALRPDDEEIARDQQKNTAKADKETEESSASTHSNSKQNSMAFSSQDSLSGHDTVICSNNNEEDCGEQRQRDNKKCAEKNQCTDVNAEANNKKEERSASENILVSGNSANEESSSNSTKEGRKNCMVDDISGNSANEEISNSTEEEEVNNKTDLDNVSGNFSNEETSSNSTEDEGTPKNDISETSNEHKVGNNKDKTLSKDCVTSTDKTGEEKDGATGIDQTQKGSYESLPKRLLNYTAMTLPCIDFPAMIKRNQAAREANTVIIPPLHVTITLMSDKDPRRRCFHCVFTNSEGTNGALGIITPELLASLFSTPLPNANRRKKIPHQRKRARGGTTRVGQSVSTSTVQNISSDNEEDEMPPSPLLMPPPDDNPKQEDGEKASRIEMVY